MNISTIVSLYITIGLFIGSIFINTAEHKSDGKFAKFVLLIAMTFGWLVALISAFSYKSSQPDLIEKLDVGNPIGNFNLTADDAPVYPEGSFANGTSKLTVVEFDEK